MSRQLTQAEIGQALLGSWFLLLVAMYFVLFVVLPFCAVIVTLNIRKIRKELQQLNETLSLPSRRL